MDTDLTDDAPRTEHYRQLARRSHQARRVNAVEARIAKLVSEAPPLTTEQRDRLAALLRPVASPTRSANGTAVTS